MLTDRFRENNDNELNMTPMLDIVFIMLIFFIVTASFVRESGLEVARPEATTANEQRQAGILIALSARNEIWINRRAVPLTALSAHIEQLHAQQPKTSVVIQADDMASTGMLVQVMDAVRRAGITAIAIAATPK